jgi:7,8-dihydro-6-hydroxymethylpterin-pyrophosphokinase
MLVAVGVVQRSAPHAIHHIDVDVLVTQQIVHQMHLAAASRQVEARSAIVVSRIEIAPVVHHVLDEVQVTVASRLAKNVH